MAFGRRHQWRNHQLARRDSLLQKVTQLASKLGVQNSIRQQSRTRRFDKAASGINSAGRDEAMHVGMNAEIPSPCVQRGNDAWFCTEMCWIREQFFERPACSGHQHVGKEFPIELPEHVQLFGDGEDDVSVITREQIGGCFLQPVRSTPPLALGTGTMSAGVEFEFGELATVTRFEVGTELFCAASNDVSGGTKDIRSKLSMCRP